MKKIRVSTEDSVDTEVLLLRREADPAGFGLSLDVMGECSGFNGVPSKFMPTGTFECDLLEIGSLQM